MRSAAPSLRGQSFGYYPALDGVRALAIAAVVGVHTGVLAGGGSGVLVFFALSGFLITSLLLAERCDTGRIDLRLFFARRALRLLPALFVMVGAVCVACLARRGTPLSRETLHFAAAALFYFGNWIRAAHAHFTGGYLAHTWSLSVEEQFYVVWAGIVALVVLAGGRRRTLLAVALAGAVLSDVAKVLVWAGGSAAADANRMWGTDLSCDGLMLGCAFAIAALSRPEAVRGVVRWLGPPAALFLAWVVLLDHPLGASFARDRFYETVLWPATSLCAAIVVAHVVLLPRSLGARILGLAPLRYLGRVSYSLYLWHYPVIVWLIVTFGFVRRPWQVIVEVAVSLGLAIASHEIVERPALRLKARLRPIGRASGTPGAPDVSVAVADTRAALP